MTAIGESGRSARFFQNNFGKGITKRRSGEQIANILLEVFFDHGFEL
jgi:hypothetical protein